MPIVTLELLEDAKQQPVSTTVLQAVTDELGGLFSSAPGGTWVKLRTLPREQYAENASTVPTTVRATFVEVLQRDADTTTAERVIEAAHIASIVAQHLDRPVANTHVIYAPPGAGRVAFGGILIPETTPTTNSE